MHRILIVTDKSKDVAEWHRTLVQAGFPVTQCGGEREALLEALVPRPPELFILHGAAARIQPAELRQAVTDNFPSCEARLIWLATEDQVAALDPAAGPDDFAIVPCTPLEVLARVRLLLWKTHRVDGADLIVAGDLVIDQANYSVAVSGQALELTFKEYELLRFLASHRGRVFTREALLNQVWGYDYFGGTRTVDVHIRRIRARSSPVLDGRTRKSSSPAAGSSRPACSPVASQINRPSCDGKCSLSTPRSSLGLSRAALPSSKKMSGGRGIMARSRFSRSPGHAPTG